MALGTIATRSRESVEGTASESTDGEHDRHWESEDHAVEAAGEPEPADPWNGAGDVAQPVGVIAQVPVVPEHGAPPSLEAVGSVLNPTETTGSGIGSGVAAAKDEYRKIRSAVAAL